MLARTVVARAIVRSGSARPMSSVPRMHKAKDLWPKLKEETRPHGHHAHVSWTTELLKLLYLVYFCISSLNLLTYFIAVGLRASLQCSSCYWNYSKRFRFRIRIHVHGHETPAIQAGILEVMQYTQTTECT
jgi:hypothetical protein